MTNLDQIITQGQIAFALMVIAVAVVYYVFAKKPTRPKR